MYNIEPIFANMFGGNSFQATTMKEAHDCAMSLFEEEENVLYVDISSSSGDYLRMYRKREGGFGFKVPWEIPEDEV